MNQSNRRNAARAVAGLLLATGLPALAEAASPRSKAPAKAEPPRADRQQAAAGRISPVLEFLAQSVGNEQEPQASPHIPPGPPPGRPPASPPGQNNPPNPPGQPPDRPPAHSGGGS
jgi:hypothetical protein